MLLSSLLLYFAVIVTRTARSFGLQWLLCFVVFLSKTDGISRADTVPPAPCSGGLPRPTDIIHESGRFGGLWRDYAGVLRNMI